MLKPLTAVRQIFALGLTLVSFTAFGEEFVPAESMSGAGFFDQFDFHAIKDPTEGFVRYVDRPTAERMKLIGVNRAGNVVIKVDDRARRGEAPASLRLHSKRIYNQGLIILDVQHIPEGNGTWPAFWTLGPDWPKTGEIDILEQINDSPVNRMSIHQGGECSMHQVSPDSATGKFITPRKCEGPIGCGYDGDDASFGPKFNRNGGGVYATNWNENKIEIFFFPRAKIPRDITSGRPNPKAWGKPVARFELGANCPASHFVDHALVVNTTLCGVWAGPHFKGKTGQGKEACEKHFQQNPQALRSAYWEIRSIKTYLPTPSIVVASEQSSAVRSGQTGRQ